MAESNGGSKSPRAVLRAVLEEAGASGALSAALGIAQLTAPPESREDLFRFINGPLSEALVGMLHPASVTHVLASMRERLAEVDRSGTRMRSDGVPEPDRGGSERPGAPTMPPPAGTLAQSEYEDLVSGAVHSRVTPAWGLSRVDRDALPGETVWAIVSNDIQLLQEATVASPSTVDVVVISSMAVLKGALERASSPASAVILDAQSPSISMDRAIACLTSDAMTVKVILWRMPTDHRTRLLEAIPHARTWLPCEAEVTPAEILQLLQL